LKLKVIKKFRDKFTRIIYNIGDTYETKSKKRAVTLQNKGFLETKSPENKPKNTKIKVKTTEFKPEMPKIEPLEDVETTLTTTVEDEDPVPPGEIEIYVVKQKLGGWYELSDGRVVRKSEIPDDVIITDGD